MSTTIAMWLGIVFVVCAIAAVILQAWLWSFPMDPPDDPKGKSLAPRSWTNVHRAVGLVYVIIYVVLMVEMVPRLWEYQIELPARTVMHAVMGIGIGVLLAAKVSIIRFFQHFGKALPTIGLCLLFCTLVLATLSIPIAVRAHGLSGRAFAEDNLVRVKSVLSELDFGRPVDVAELVSKSSLLAGRDVLTSKCTACHDLRTVLQKPRTGKGWLEVVGRMAQKPNPLDPLTEDDLPRVTAYLVALSPDLQESVKEKKASERALAEQAAEVAKGMAAFGSEGAEGAGPAFDPAAVKPVYEKTCSQCHELSDITEHGPDDVAGWTKTVTRMIEENEAEIEPAVAKDIIQYLVAAHGK
jgi:cytochrome c5